jgi:hypothetical protein
VNKFCLSTSTGATLATFLPPRRIFRSLFL